jgi:ATP-dependent Clp protease ATP-binding subunit ClpA
MGLLLASRGVGQYTLEHLQVDLPGLKQSIEKRLSAKVPADIVTQILESGASRIVLLKAEREARRFGHRYIGTEHLLLGILSEGKSGAVEVLHEHGIDLHAARLAITEILGTVRSGD